MLVVTSVFFFVQDRFDYPWSFVLLYKFKDFSISVKNGPGTFIGITLNLKIVFL